MGARAMTHLVPPIALSVGIVKTSRSDAHGGSTERASRTAKRGHSSPFRDRTKAALTVSRIWHFQRCPPCHACFPEGFAGSGTTNRAGRVGLEGRASALDQIHARDGLGAHSG